MNTIKLIYTPNQVPFLELDYIMGQDVLTSNIIAIVPEQFAFDAEKYLINQMASKGLFHVRVYGFKKFIYEFSYLVGVDNKDIISDFGKSLMMIQILKRIDDQLDIYRAAFRSKSYVEMIISQLDSLRTEEISPDNLFEMSEDAKIINPSLSKKLYELGIILKEYLAYFEGDTIDEIELSSRLKTYFLSSEGDFFLDSYSLIVDGFSGMASTEVSLITAIASKAEESFIRILHAKTGVASRYSHKFISQIEQSFSEIAEPYMIEEISLPFHQAEKNAAAFASLFEYENRSLLHKPNFEIVKASDKDEEITYIAHDILSKMRSGDYSWSDFALITGNIESYDYNIDKIFQRYGIPYFRDESIPLTAFDFMVFIIASLKSVNNNFSNKNVIESLKLSACLSKDEDEFKEKYAMACEIERYVLTMNVNYDRWFRNDSFAFLLKDDTEKKEKLMRFKNSVLYRLKDLRDELKNKHLLKEKLNALKTYLDSFHFDAIIEEKILYYSEVEDEENLKKFMAIKKALSEILEQMAIFSPAVDISTEYFIELFVSALSLYKAGKTPPNELSVLSGSIERSKFMGIKFLYVLGANEGSLPSANFSANSIFTSNELSYLDEISPYDFKTVNKFMDKEVYDLYEKIILTSEKTIFTYPSHNNKKEEIAPSIWLKNLMKIYDIKEKNFELSLENISSSGVASAFYESVFLTSKPSHLKKHRDLLEKTRYLNDYLDSERKLLPSLKKSVEDYVKKVARAKDGEGINTYKLSVSRLERQALCPYGFFVEYALKPVKNDYDEIDYAMMGNVFHRALETFVNNYIKSEDKSAYFEQSEDILKADFLKSQDEEDVLSINKDLKERFQFFEPSIKYISKAILMQLDVREDCKIQAITEKAFKHSFINEDEEKKLMIEGKIDRLDVIDYKGEQYLRVVDYKTGNKEFKDAELKEGLQLQLLSYLKALLDGEYHGAEPLGAFYHSIRETLSDDVEVHEKIHTDDEILKNYRMSGRYVNNEDVLMAVDKALYQSGESVATNLKLTKKGNLNKRIGTLIEREEFDELLEITEENMWKLLAEIESANIGVKSHDSKDYPCPYCGYNGILKLDKMKYRHLFKDE